jgi:hypothetical protein
MFNPSAIDFVAGIGLAAALVAAPLAGAVEKAPVPPAGPAASTPLKKLDIGPKKPPIVPPDKPVPAVTQKAKTL